MWNVAVFLCILIGASVPAGFLDASLATGLAGAGGSLALLAVLVAIRPGELSFLKSVAGVYLAATLLPLLWIVLQICPLPFWAHPVWKLAGETLATPLGGSISIDTGASVGALMIWLSLVSSSIAAAALAIDSRRAGVLARCVAATAVVAAILLLLQGDPIAAGSRRDWLGPLAPALAANANGLMVIVLAGAPLGLARALEGAGGGAGGRIAPPSLRRLLWAASTLFAALAAWRYGHGGAAIAVAGGGLLVLMIFAARRFGMQRWSRAAVAASIALIALATAVANRHPNVALAVAFAEAPAETVQSTHDLLADLPALGSGVGTTAMLASTYMDWQGAATRPAVATTAAALIAQFGRVPFWTALALVIAAISALAAGALDRGRDWSFAAAASAALLTLVIAAFTLSELPPLPGIIVLGTVIGTGLAQRISRSRLQAG